MTKKNQIEWVRVGSVDRQPDGPGTASVVRSLKAAGIRARSAHSPYVNNQALEVERGKLTATRRVLRNEPGWRWAATP